MKKFNYYSDNVDRVWYDSSNIAYSECIDHDNELKTLKVVFKNGTQYLYEGVDVNQYLLFRENESQGKALNKYIKANGYKYTKLENADLKALDDELFFRSGKGYFVENNDDSFIIKDSQDNERYKLDKPLDEDTFNMVCDILKSLDLNIREKNGNNS
jgi:hypothetical protein